MLISIEGIDGSGKTTVAHALVDFLQKEGYPAVLFKDPGDTPLAEEIRSLLFKYEMDPITELLLFEAARSSLTWEKILPALSEGKIVILDRFIDSTVAYQGYGREINLGTVSILNHIATRGIKPNLTLLLNVPLHVALSRLSDRSRFEREEYLRKVRDAYILLAHQEKERIKIVDASRSFEEVFEEVKTEVLSVLYNKET
ncbi:thymidylate kinase [Thermocrinis albus DSM 14484]|uniref:Thymidylate kinase n=1 Tax=Thermocrinis albus (strain DSM 14484 / JCM 11386 / HI 11/12) TaxID=638303 RepID=D3SM76_THEAH|nr:dTMP kinase [Thermocrinis albus]ADC89856.1 thymidylate kinase [Thermocrinis albus DSM 14484]